MSRPRSTKKKPYRDKSELVALESERLRKDIANLEDALYLHSRYQAQGENSVRGLIRKEIGGSHWEHGGKGKLTTYRGNEDLEGSDEYRPLSKKTHRSQQHSQRKETETSREDERLSLVLKGSGRGPSGKAGKKTKASTHGSETSATQRNTSSSQHAKQLEVKCQKAEWKFSETNSTSEEENAAKPPINDLPSHDASREDVRNKKREAASQSDVKERDTHSSSKHRVKSSGRDVKAESDRSSYLDSKPVASKTTKSQLNKDLIEEKTDQGHVEKIFNFYWNEKVESKTKTKENSSNSSHINSQSSKSEKDSSLRGIDSSKEETALSLNKIRSMNNTTSSKPNEGNGFSDLYRSSLYSDGQRGEKDLGRSKDISQPVFLTESNLNNDNPSSQYQTRQRSTKDSQEQNNEKLNSALKKDKGGLESSFRNILSSTPVNQNAGLFPRRNSYSGSNSDLSALEKYIQSGFTCRQSEPGENLSLNNNSCKETLAGNLNPMLNRSNSMRSGSSGQTTSFYSYGRPSTASQSTVANKSKPFSPKSSPNAAWGDSSTIFGYGGSLSHSSSEGIPPKLPSQDVEPSNLGTSCDPQVKTWLETLGLQSVDRYQALFGVHQMDMASVQLLTATQLRDMGIHALGPIMKIMKGVQILERDETSGANFTQTTSDQNLNGSERFHVSVTVKDKNQSVVSSDVERENVLHSRDREGPDGAEPADQGSGRQQKTSQAKKNFSDLSTATDKPKPLNAEKDLICASEKLAQNQNDNSDNETKNMLVSEKDKNKLEKHRPNEEHKNRAKSAQQAITGWTETLEYADFARSSEQRSPDLKDELPAKVQVRDGKKTQRKMTQNLPPSTGKRPASGVKGSRGRSATKLSSKPPVSVRLTDDGVTVAAQKFSERQKQAQAKEMAEEKSAFKQKQMRDEMAARHVQRRRSSSLDRGRDVQSGRSTLRRSSSFNKTIAAAESLSPKDLSGEIDPRQSMTLGVVRQLQRHLSDLEQQLLQHDEPGGDGTSVKTVTERSEHEDQESPLLSVTGSHCETPQSKARQKRRDQRKRLTGKALLSQSVEFLVKEKLEAGMKDSQRMNTDNDKYSPLGREKSHKTATSKEKDRSPDKEKYSPKFKPSQVSHRSEISDLHGDEKLEEDLSSHFQVFGLSSHHENERKSETVKEETKPERSKTVRQSVRQSRSDLFKVQHMELTKKAELNRLEIMFREQDFLGEGTFSQVFRGTYLGSEVAVKRLRNSLVSKDKNYFSAEISMLQELRHPHVLMLLGVCTSERLPLIILEYMDNGNLFSALHESHKLSESDIYQISRDVSSGMLYLHLHQPPVLHLDLKSKNVLLTRTMRAKVADFGFSKLKHEANERMSRASRAQLIQGTPAWMAPELLAAGEITVKADVYSFAIILWEMLTGDVPYEGCSVFQILENVRRNKRPSIPNTILENVRLNKRPTIPNNCPALMKELIQKSWAPNPAVRPSFKEILNILDELEQSDATISTPTTTPSSVSTHATPKVNQNSVSGRRQLTPKQIAMSSSMDMNPWSKKNEPSNVQPALSVSGGHSDIGKETESQNMKNQSVSKKGRVSHLDPVRLQSVSSSSSSSDDDDDDDDQNDSLDEDASDDDDDDNSSDAKNSDDDDEEEEDDDHINNIEGKEEVGKEKNIVSKHTTLQASTDSTQVKHKKTSSESPDEDFVKQIEVKIELKSSTKPTLSEGFSDKAFGESNGSLRQSVQREQDLDTLSKPQNQSVTEVRTEKKNLSEAQKFSSFSQMANVTRKSQEESKLSGKGSFDPVVRDRPTLAEKANPMRISQEKSTLAEKSNVVRASQEKSSQNQSEQLDKQKSTVVKVDKKQNRDETPKQERSLHTSFTSPSDHESIQSQIQQYVPTMRSKRTLSKSLDMFARAAEEDAHSPEKLLPLRHSMDKPKPPITPRKSQRVKDHIREFRKSASLEKKDIGEGSDFDIKGKEKISERYSSPRVINSSPRISGSLTQVKNKSSGESPRQSFSRTDKHTTEVEYKSQADLPHKSLDLRRSRENISASFNTTQPKKVDETGISNSLLDDVTQRQSKTIEKHPSQSVSNASEAKEAKKTSTAAQSGEAQSLRHEARPLPFLSELRKTANKPLSQKAQNQSEDVPQSASSNQPSIPPQAFDLAKDSTEGEAKYSDLNKNSEVKDVSSDIVKSSDNVLDSKKKTKGSSLVSPHDNEQLLNANLGQSVSSTNAGFPDNDRVQENEKIPIETMQVSPVNNERPQSASSDQSISSTITPISEGPSFKEEVRLDNLGSDTESSTISNISMDSLSLSLSSTDDEITPSPVLRSVKYKQKKARKSTSLQDSCSNSKDSLKELPQFSKFKLPYKDPTRESFFLFEDSIHIDPAGDPHNYNPNSVPVPPLQLAGDSDDFENSSTVKPQKKPKTEASPKNKPNSSPSPHKYSQLSKQQALNEEIKSKTSTTKTKKTDLDQNEAKKKYITSQKSPSRSEKLELSGTNVPQPPVPAPRLHLSPADIIAQKQKLLKRPPGSPRNRLGTTQQRPVGGSTRFSVDAHSLLDRKAKLRPVVTREPLTPITLMSAEREDGENRPSVASLLKKAMSERRFAMGDNTESHDTTPDASWSLQEEES